MGLRRALGGGDGVVAGGWVFVGEGQRRPGFAQVPDQVATAVSDPVVDLVVVDEWVLLP